MSAPLRLDRVGDLALLELEGRLLERRQHAAAGERAEQTRPLACRIILRELECQVGKALAGVEAGPCHGGLLHCVRPCEEDVTRDDPLGALKLVVAALVTCLDLLRVCV